MEKQEIPKAQNSLPLLITNVTNRLINQGLEEGVDFTIPNPPIPVSRILVLLLTPVENDRILPISEDGFPIEYDHPLVKDLKTRLNNQYN